MKKLILFCLLLAVSDCLAQNQLAKAHKFFREYSYNEAAQAYEAYLEKEKSPATQVLKNIGDSYYFTDDMRNASKWYQRLYDVQGTKIDEEHFLRYIASTKAILDYERADKATKEYLLKNGSEKQIAHFTNQKRQMDSLTKAKSQYSVYNLPSNTDKADFGTAFFGNKIVYSSSKDTTKFREKRYNWNNEPFLSLYVAERHPENGTFFNEMNFLPNVQTKYHESTVAFSKDLSQVYYTTNILKGKKLVNDEEGTNNFKIVRGTLNGINLKNSEDIFFNDKSYSVGHPALSDDGKWLFFASDMPGGLGGADLYVCQIADDGTLGPPKNLGSDINTAANDMFPSFTNGILYFASDGHYGWGGLDIYESKFYGNLRFSEPRNLGAPVNSNRDDFAFIIEPGEEFGYFSSNRSGGKGSDDIYSFRRLKIPCDQYVSGIVTNLKSKSAIADATVKAMNQFGNEIAQAVTGSDGRYMLPVPCNLKLKVITSKENYSNDEEEVQTNKVNQDEIKNVNFELNAYEDLVVKSGDTEKIDINPIFFEYDKSEITAEAAAELDKVVFAMNSFPKLRIKIESHTDSRGKDDYNLALSDARAKATQTYLLSKGINASRIESAAGYGETRLTNGCADGVSCSEQQHFANRRSDFIVVEK